MYLDTLGNTCVIGLQWGDEGKGKIVDILVERFDAVVRFSGGANAGHTIVANGERFALHQLPSGVLRPNVICMIGCGAVIDPAVVLGEIESLRQRGIHIGDNLRISERAQLVFPYHRRQDILAERAAGSAQKLGTTARGIGPCYADKVSRRWGVRVCELFDADRFRKRLGNIIAHKNAYLVSVYDDLDPFDAKAITDEYLAFAEELKPYVASTAYELADLMARGKRILFEGAQGAMLDIDHGTYPYVTSANTGAGGAASGAGVPPTAIQDVVGVLKAYTTRVGEGPLPTELHGDVGNAIRDAGHEFGTTTGRARRCGWFDRVAASLAVTVNGPTQLALMHLDTLSGLGELKVCVGYRCGSEVLRNFPADVNKLAEAQPVYETLAGWHEDLSDCRNFDDLPDTARTYVEFISEQLGVPVTIIGVGPSRDQTIFVQPPEV